MRGEVPTSFGWYLAEIHVNLLKKHQGPLEGSVAPELICISKLYVLNMEEKKMCSKTEQTEKLHLPKWGFERPSRKTSPSASMWPEFLWPFLCHWLEHGNDWLQTRRHTLKSSRTCHQNMEELPSTEHGWWGPVRVDGGTPTDGGEVKWAGLRRIA